MARIRIQQQTEHERQTSQTLTTALGDALVRLLSGGPEPLIGPPEPETPSCPRCEGKGFLYTGPAGDCRVECPHLAEEQARRRPERLLKHWENATGIPKHYRGLRLETHPNLTGTDLLERLQSADFAHSSWLFWGERSMGKTGIAVGYAWRFLNVTGESVLCRTVPDLLGELRSTYGRHRDDEDGPTEADLMHRYRNAGLLVLDDLGAEQIKESKESADPENTWVADRLYTIINYRLGAELPIVFTTNLRLRDVRDRVGARISERVIEMTDGGKNIVQVTGRNLRWND